jgi:hypothetical protein
MSILDPLRGTATSATATPSRHHNRHHNPAASHGVSWRFTTSRLAEIRLRGALPLPMALYGEVPPETENHGVPGSSPGPATYIF